MTHLEQSVGGELFEARRILGGCLSPQGAHSPQVLEDIVSEAQMRPLPLVLKPAKIAVSRYVRSKLGQIRSCAPSFRRSSTMYAGGAKCSTGPTNFNTYFG